ncbi:MAG TPA: hypothetical protein VL400_00255 [Polyangiaceae bacterium]|jgi:hypothetical protein|nr:hypothetical protein [Polyangiaceae bacterium]
MRRSTGIFRPRVGHLLFFAGVCGIASTGCQDFDAFATGTAGAGGGSTVTSTTTTGGGGSGGAGPTTTTGSGGSGGQGGGTGAAACLADAFDSPTTTGMVFTPVGETGQPPTFSLAGGQLTLSGKPNSRGTIQQKTAGALADCFVSLEVAGHATGAATFLALEKNGNSAEYVQIGIEPLVGGDVAVCARGTVDATPVLSCAAPGPAPDVLRIRVSGAGLELEALQGGALQGTPVPVPTPSWIGDTKIAIGLDTAVSVDNNRDSIFDSLGGTPP